MTSKPCATCLAAALLFLSLPLPAEPAPASMTVDQAVTLAVHNNLDLKNVVLQSAVLQRTKDHSFNILFPTISTSATALRLNDTRSYTVLASPQPLPYGTYSTADANNLGLNLKIQEIFTPAIVAQFAQMDINLKNSMISREQAERSMTASVRKSFFQLLLLRETISLTQSQLNNADERLRQSEVSLRLGQETELNNVQNQSAADNLRSQLEQQKTSYMNNLITFQELLGVEPRIDLLLDGILDSSHAELPSTEILAAHRLDVDSQKGKVKNLRTSRDLQVLSVLPALIFQYSADPNLNGPQSSNILDTGKWVQKTGASSLTLSWNLESFIPGSSFWDKQNELDGQILLAEETTGQVRKNGIDDIENHRRLIQTSLRTIETLRNVVKSNQRALELTNLSYRAGMGKLLDLLSAEFNNQSAQVQLLNEEVNLKSLVFDLEAQLDQDLSSF